jgi:hypothetical protein
MAGGGGGGGQSIGGYVPPVNPLSQRDLEILGYVGGGVLALCLVPQIARLVVNRSARDVSALWSLLYMSGLALTFVYLYFQGAIAAWIPLIVEMCGCVAILGLKIAFDCTPWGEKQGEKAAERRRVRRAAGKGGIPAAGVGARVTAVPSAAVLLAPPGARGEEEEDVEAAAVAAAKAGR